MLPSINVLGEDLPIKRFDRPYREDYIVSVGGFEYLVCCYYSTDWNPTPLEGFKNFNEYLYHHAEDLETRISEFANQWPGITIAELGDMYTKDGTGIPVNYLISKYKLPAEARTWLSSLERCQAIWAAGSSAYTPEERALPGIPIQWFWNGEFSYAPVDNGCLVQSSMGLEFVHTKRIFTHLGGSYKQIGKHWKKIAL